MHSAYMDLRALAATLLTFPSPLPQPCLPSLPADVHKPGWEITLHSFDSCPLFSTVVSWHVEGTSLTWEGEEKRSHIHCSLVWQEWVHIGWLIYIFSFKNRSPILSSIICINRVEIQIWLINPHFTVKSDISTSYISILVFMFMWLKLHLKIILNLKKVLGIWWPKHYADNYKDLTKISFGWVQGILIPEEMLVWILLDGPYSVCQNQNSSQLQKQRNGKAGLSFLQKEQLGSNRCGLNKVMIRITFCLNSHSDWLGNPSVGGRRCRSRIQSLQRKSIKPVWTIIKWMSVKDRGKDTQLSVSRKWWPSGPVLPGPEAHVFIWCCH